MPHERDKDRTTSAEPSRERGEDDAGHDYLSAMTRQSAVQRREFSEGIAPGRISISSQMNAPKHPIASGLVQKKAKAAVATDAVHDAAAQGVASPTTALPHGEAIQKSFGPQHDVSGIQAHVGGDAAAAMGATAFAAGNHVVFDQQPDLHTAAHEVAHVVQQAQGVNLYGGVGQAGDAYELQADAVADRVVAGQSAADLLAAGSGSCSTLAVQRKGLPGLQGPKGDTGKDGAKGDAGPAGAKGEPGHDAHNDLKAQLIVFTRSRMETAFTAFTAACQYVGNSIKAKAKAEAELFAALVEIVMGFMLPGLSRGLGKLVGKIPLTLSEKTKVVMQKMYIDLSNDDLGKALVQGATKTVTTAIKQNATVLFGDTQGDHFLRALQVQFQIGFQKIEENLESQTLETVAALCAAFDANVTNVETYVASVNTLFGHFEAEVESIHSTTITPMIGGRGAVSERTSAYWLFDKNDPDRGSYLAICDKVTEPSAFSVRTTTRFVTWVSSEMKDMALAKAAAVHRVPFAADIRDITDAPPTVPDDPKQYARLT